MFTFRRSLTLLCTLVLSLAMMSGSAWAEDRDIRSVTGVNGELTVRFAGPGTRSLDDFTISYVDRGGVTAVTPIQMWPTDGGREVRIQVPAHTPQRDTPATYRVSHAGQAEVPSRRFVIRPGVSLVLDGVAHAVLVRPAAASDQLRTDVEDLRRLIMVATGVQLDVIEPAGVAGARADGLIPIRVGTAAPDRQPELQEALTGLGEQAYVIDSAAQGITLLGASEAGTRHAVIEFAERFLGVRWLMPGELGEDVPDRPQWMVPQLRAVDAPAIESRVIHPLHNPGRTEQSIQNHAWGQRARVASTIEGYSHNLWRIFQPRPGQPAEDWPTTHPEYYPILGGERHIPTNTVRWQPHFSEPGTVDAAVAWINDWFDANPEVTSFSLAVNDSGGFAESEPEHPNNPHRKNSFGYDDLSDVYYQWVNEVVAGVLAEHPDKWFGLLAYREVADPPSFALHPRVVPYTTKERLTWIDDDVRELGHQRMAAWREVTPNIAFYDYAYGARYMVPRVYPHQMASYLRYGVDHGLRAYFGESDPTWGEGPKLYETARLLWNPYRNVDADLDDWYRRTGGPAAAPYLRDYFTLWEDFWTRRVTETSWFQSRKEITYLSFYMPTYLEGVTAADMATARSLLEAALAATVTEAQRARVQLLLKAFEYYEASVLSYPREVTPPQTSADALALVDRIEQLPESVAFARKRVELYEGFADDPYLRPQKTLTSLRAEWSGLQPKVLWALAGYVASGDGTDGPVRERLQALTSDEAPLVAQYAATILQAADGNWANRNPSFEEGGTSAAGWESVVRNYGEFRRVESGTAALTGAAGIEVHEFYAGELVQTMPARPGLWAVRLHHFVSTDTQTVGDTWLTLRLLDATGGELGVVTSARTPFMEGKGRWQTQTLAAQVPPTVDGVEVAAVSVSVMVNGFFEGGHLYLDDFQVVTAEPVQTAAVTGVELAAGEPGTGAVTVATTGVTDPPTAQDFTVQRMVSGQTPTTVVPTDFSWDPDTGTATFTLDLPEPKPWDQEVGVGVAHRESLVAWSGQLTVTGTAVDWTQVAANPSLEQWPDAGSPPTDWTYWRGDRFRRTTDARTGQYAVECTGFSAAENETGGGGPRQLDIPITPGQYLAIARFRAPVGTSGTMRLRVRFRAADGTILANVAGENVAVSGSRGEWITLGLDTPVPTMINGRVPVTADLLLMFQDIPTGSSVVADDVEFVRAP
ncbi:DUF4838 domain-containing protein [Microlunatus sp. Y2014]|uniref:DUF4838 domain-containing protein n=1 Tax=Microlunatus sp. Y2014 TaxID=3418488 RepID=UPI003DA71A3A